MQPLFHSAFLQALGFAIANSLWQAALLWLVYTGISQVLPLSAAKKYRLAVAAQLLSFCWFVGTIQFYYAQYSSALAGYAGGVAHHDSVQAFAAGNNGFSSQLLRYILHVEKILPLVSMAYLLLMLVLFMRWLLSYRQTQAIRNAGLEKIAVDWRLFVKKITAQLGIKREVLVYLSLTANTPLTIGFWKPIILVPIASINHLTTAQLEAILLHELAHVKRNDYLVNIILSAVEIALFFNPFTQLISRTISKERENSCDDWVLQYQYEASDYAQALLRVASLQQAPMLAMAAARNRNELLTRVKRMIGQQENSFNYRRQLLAFLLVTGLFGSIAWLNSVVAPHEKNTITRTVAPVQQMRDVAAVKSLDHEGVKTLFNPVFFLSQPMKEVIEHRLAEAAQELVDPPAAPDKPDMDEAEDQSIQTTTDVPGETWKGNLMEKKIAAMNGAKPELKKIMDDSLLWNKLNGKRMADEIAHAMAAVNGNFENTTKELAAATESMQSILKDREKIYRNIERAMQEMKNIRFEKTIQLPARYFPKKPVITRKPETLQPPNSEQVIIALPQVQLNAPGAEELSMPLINATQRQFLLSPQMIAEFSALAAYINQLGPDNITPEIEKRIRLRFTILERLANQRPLMKLRVANVKMNTKSENEFTMELDQ